MLIIWSSGLLTQTVCSGYHAFEYLNWSFYNLNSKIWIWCFTFSWLLALSICVWITFTNWHPIQESFWNLHTKLFIFCLERILDYLLVIYWNYPAIIQSFWSLNHFLFQGPILQVKHEEFSMSKLSSSRCLDRNFLKKPLIFEITFCKKGA